MREWIYELSDWMQEKEKVSSSLEPVTKPQFQPKSAPLPQDSVPSQIAYGPSDMSICDEREPAPKPSNLCKKASFATGSLFNEEMELAARETDSLLHASDQLQQVYSELLGKVNHVSSK